MQTLAPLQPDPRVSRGIPRRFTQGIFAPCLQMCKEDLSAPEHSGTAPRAASNSLKAQHKGKTT